MSKVRVHISVSADGYVAGPDQSLENPLGEGGERLHERMIVLRAWREPHGMEGGELNASTAFLEEATANVGAASRCAPTLQNRPGTGVSLLVPTVPND